MPFAQLGNLKFRIDPSSVSYDYSIDYSVIDTLGGQVIQVLGSTIGDLVIRGDFGQKRSHKVTGPSAQSWELAESFHASIRQMMDAQTLPHQGGGPSHQPVRFTYFDGTHDWDFKVLIKGIEDMGGTGSIEHKTGKFSYSYQLTLFIVEDRSLKLKKITTDQFISRISNGLGWKRSGFNGSGWLDDAINFITNHSSDGTFDSYLTNLLEGGGEGPNDPASPLHQKGSPTYRPPAIGGVPNTGPQHGGAHE